MQIRPDEGEVQGFIGARNAPCPREAGATIELGSTAARPPDVEARRGEGALPDVPETYGESFECSAQ